MGVDYFSKPIKNHLAYATLQEHRTRLDCRRIILTHMSPDMLSRRAEASEETADDGLVVSL